MPRLLGERVVVVVDLHYAFNGVMEWSEKWHKHGWWICTGEVGPGICLVGGWPTGRGGGGGGAG